MHCAYCAAPTTSSISDPKSSVLLAPIHCSFHNVERTCHSISFCSFPVIASSFFTYFLFQISLHLFSSPSSQSCSLSANILLAKFSTLSPTFAGLVEQAGISQAATFWWNADLLVCKFFIEVLYPIAVAAKFSISMEYVIFVAAR